MKLEELPVQVSNFLGIQNHSLADIVLDVQSIPKTSELDGVYDAFEKMHDGIFLPYYGTKIKPSLRQIVYSLYVEPLKNANFYSENVQNISAYSIFSPFGFIFGFKDGGSYFSRPDVKQAWESRSAHSEKHEKAHESVGFSNGRLFINEMADLIHVDTTSATLYVGKKI